MEILIAEDSRTQAEQLKYILAENGYRVTVTSDGKQALAAARERKPDIIISDIVMPQMDGYNLCKAIKSDTALKDIPIILVTMLSDPHDIIKGLKCGADNFIKKPYSENYLLSRIAYLQLNRQMRRNERLQWGVEVYLMGERYLITAGRQQLLDLLLSTYEQAVEVNDELKAKQKELIRSNQILDALYGIAEGLNQAISEQQVANTALERVMELPGIQGGWIFLKTAQSQFRLAATLGLPSTLITPEVLDSDCLCLRRLLSDQLDQAQGIFECERWQGMQCHPSGRCHHASIPLRSDGKAVGVMNLIGSEPGLFGDEELKTLQIVGNEVGVALGRAWLYQHLEEKVAERTAVLSEEIAERRRIEKERERSQQFLQVILDSIRDGIVTCDAEGTLILFNRATREYYGVQEASIPPEQWAEQYQVYWPDGTTLMKMEELPLYRALQGEQVRDLEVVIGPKRGRRRTVLINGQAMCDSQGTKLGAVISMHDITERKSYEAQLQYQATHDALTHLPNRTLLQDRLNHAIARAHRSGGSVAVLFIDLDRFKTVNDSLGHCAGDALLRGLAMRLKASVRESDTVARQGGDEFVMAVLEDLSEEYQAATVAHRVLKALESPFTVEGREFFMAASIGISLFPKDGEDVKTLLKNADSALYRAKEQGGNSIQFYSMEMNDYTLGRLEMETQLRYALEREELELYYQPQVSLESGRVIGVEALLRWRHPQREMISPAQFIALAEETGLIIPIGEWVLMTACAQARTWQDAGLPPLTVGVNLSARQFMGADLMAMIVRILQKVGLEAPWLELEITEGLLMKDVEGTIRTLRALKDMGIGLAIDDFGTGYSSLSYLKRFPIDRLKIDQSFVRDITTDPDDAAIAAAIIALAHSLKLKVIAEGVETEGQLTFLRSRHCDEMQGYYFSQPLSARAMTELLRENRTLARSQPQEAVCPRTLLLVDDEADVTASLSQLLCRDGYRILTAHNAREGLGLLARHRIGVVVADQVMPQMDGTEFLRRVRELYPDTVRIVLSGRSDLNFLVDAINEGAIFKFFSKPVPLERLQEGLREAFLLYEMQSRRAA